MTCLEHLPSLSSFTFSFPSIDTVFQGRFSVDWKEHCLIAGTILSICAFVITFFLNVRYLYITFGLLTLSNGIGAYCAHDLALRARIQDLVTEQERLVTEQERNGREYQTTLTGFQTQLQEQITTNTQLTSQVALLSTQLHTLSGYSQSVRDQLEQLANQTQSGHAYVGNLRELIASLDHTANMSQHLQNEWNRQSGDLGQKIHTLSQEITRLQTDNVVGEKLKQLNLLQQELRMRSQELSKIHSQLATLPQEVQRLKQIRNGLAQVKDELRADVSTLTSLVQETANREPPTHYSINMD